MQWSRVGDHPPPNKKLLVWRKRSKKYNVCSPSEYRPFNKETMTVEPFKKRCWINEYSGGLEMKDDDYWMEFPYLETTIKYE